MGNGTGALYGFLYQLCWSVVRALESTVCIQRPLDPQRTPNGLVRLELEGASDITERQGSLLRYIQVKSRGRGSGRWTLPALLSEVLTSFAQIDDDVTARREFVFVTDADLDENCQHLAALSEELRRRADYIDSDEAWQAAAETLSATGRVVTPRSSPKTLGDRLSCPVEELPGELATRGVFPGLHTPGAVARFIAAVRLVGPASLEALRERVRDDLRKRVPKDKVDDFERELIAKCLEYCSLRAGHQFTGAELLEQVGIMGEEYRWDLLVARSAQALPERIRLMPPREPQYAVREEAHRTFRDFLASESRVIVILGPARTGKTRLACALAESECAGRTITWLHKAKGFEVAEVGRELCGLLGHESDTRIATRYLMERLADEARDQPPAVILIDALDEDDTSMLPRELARLWEIVVAVPVKVCVTCKSSEWRRFRREFGPIRDLLFAPPDEQLAERGRALHELPCFELGGFSEAELDEALALNLPQYAAATLASPQILSPEFRRLLQAPEMFSIYCALSQDARRRVSGSAVSFVEITGEFWRERTEAAADRLGRRRSSVRRALEALAVYLQGAADGELAASLDCLPAQAFAQALDLDKRDSTTGVLAALVHVGMLELLDDGPERVRFAHDTMLDHALMCALRADLPGELGDEAVVEGWVDQRLPTAPDPRNNILLGGLALLLQGFELEGQRAAAVGLSRAVLGRWWLSPGEYFFRYVGELAVPALQEIYLALPAASGDEWPRTRAAGEALASIEGAGGTHALCDALQSPVSEVRAWSARLLRRRKHLPDRAVDALIEALDDQEHRVSRNASESLARSGQPVLPKLIDGLADVRPRVASACAGIIGQIGHRSAIPVVAQWLDRTDDPEMLARLVSAIGQLDAHGLGHHAVRYLEHPDPGVRRAAAWACWRLRVEGARDSLLAKLGDPGAEETQVLDAAVVAVTRLGEYEAVLAFCDEARHQDDWAYGGLYSIWRPAEMHVPASIRALLRMLVEVGFEGTKNQWRWQILRRLSMAETPEELASFRALKHAEPDLWAAAEDLSYRIVAATRSPDTVNRNLPRDEVGYATTVLCQLGSKRVADSLAKALPAATQFVRLDVVESLAVLGSEAQVEALGRICSRDVEEWDIVRRQAGEAVRLIGGRTAGQILLRVLREDEPVVQYAAVDHDAELPPAPIDPQALRELLLDAEATPDGRLHAAFVLGLQGAQDHVDALLRIASSQSEPPGVRGWSLKALGWMKVPEAEPIADLLLQSDDPGLRLAAAEVLCQLQSERHLPVIEELLKHADDDGRRTLVWCLCFLDTPGCSDLLARLTVPPDPLGIASQDALVALARRGDARAVDLSVQVVEQHVKRSVHRSVERQAAVVLADRAPHQLFALFAGDIGAWYDDLKITALDALHTRRQPCQPADLHPLIVDADPWVRRRAARALLRCVRPEDSEAHIRHLAGTSPENAVIAADALLWTDEPWARQLLPELAEHDHGPVRWAAQHTVRQKRKKAAADQLATRFVQAASTVDAWAVGKALEVVATEDEVDALREHMRKMSKTSPQLWALTRGVVKTIEKRLEDEAKKARRKSE